MRSRAVPLVLAAALGLAACSGEDAPDEGGTTGVGARDSDCPLPMGFEVLDGWSAEQVTEQEAAELATGAYDEGTVHPAGFRLACEIESANELGYVRVFEGPAALAEQDPELVLKAFAAAVDEESNLSVRSTMSDSGVEVTEATYTPGNGLGEVRAFLAAGPDGVVAVRTAALDAEMSAALRPVHDLVLSSLRLPD